MLFPKVNKIPHLQITFLLHMAHYKFYIVLYCKSVFILVQCNTSQNKIYVAHSITAVCVIG